MWVFHQGATSLGSVADRLGSLGAQGVDAAIDFGMALVVLLVGWLIALAISTLVRVLLRAASFNRMMHRVLGWDSVESGVEPASMVAWLAFWGLMTLAILIALDVIGIHVRGAVGPRLGEVLPRVVVASFVALVGLLTAVLVGLLGRSALRGAGGSRP